MILKVRKVKSGLRRKGFEERDNDHKYFHYVTIKGVKTTITTRISHKSSGKDIDIGLIGKMARQCKLSIKNFVGLIDCNLSQEEYERLLYLNNTLDSDDIEQDS